jgi:hypothetical protein
MLPTRVDLAGRTPFLIVAKLRGVLYIPIGMTPDISHHINLGVRPTRLTEDVTPRSVEDLNVALSSAFGSHAILVQRHTRKRPRSIPI